jgi:hypothetical protein
MDEKLILATDPFAGDFGDPGDRTLRDKMVSARKPAECHDCAQTIQPGERIRSRTDVADGEMMSFKWCRLCCEAMELSGEDGGEAWDARIALRSAHNGPAEPR